MCVLVAGSMMRRLVGGITSLGQVEESNKDDLR